MDQELIRQQKQTQINKDNIRENIKRVDQDYKVRDKIMLNNHSAYKYENPYKGPFVMTHFCTNGPVTSQHIWKLPVLHYHKIMVIYPYPFLLAITQLFYWIIFINGCIRILTGSPGFFFMIVYVMRKIGGNENYPNSLNVMISYHYHGKNRVITQ